MKNFVVLLCCFFFCTPALAGQDEIDGDYLKYILSPSEAEHRRHMNDLNANELHLLLKRQREANSDPSAPPPADSKNLPLDRQTGGAGWPGARSPGVSVGSPPTFADPASAFRSGSAPSGKSIGSKSEAPGASASPARVSYRRVPPTWRSAKAGASRPAKVQSDDLKESQGVLYGIRRGAEIRAHLERATTNVAPGLAEFVTSSDCYGDYRDLPAGTKLFLKATVASGSNRLYFTSSGALNGITPEGDEFAIQCSVTDITMNKQLGLVGAITTDKKLIQRSMASGAFAAGQSIIGNSLGGGVAGDAVAAAADSALAEKEDEASASLREPTFVILVTPQDVYIRVDKSF